MSDAATVGADPSTSGGTQVHHFCPSKMRRLAAISIVGAAGLVVFAWDLLDPEWIAPQWSAGTALGKPGIGHLVVVALAALPVWMRVPIVMSGAGYLFWAVISRLAHTFDDRPDFLIRPEGVGGWDGFVFRTIPWSEVSRISVDQRPRWEIIPRPHYIWVYGATIGPPRFFGMCPPPRAKVFYTDSFFATENYWIIEALRQYRPDLVREPPSR
jgi:hypothetical protein